MMLDPEGAGQIGVVLDIRNQLVVDVDSNPLALGVNLVAIPVIAFHHWVTVWFVADGSKGELRHPSNLFGDASGERGVDDPK